MRPSPLAPLVINVNKLTRVLAVSPTVHSPVKAYIYMLRLVGVQQKTDSLEINKIVSYNIKWAFGILPLINIVIPVIIN